MPVYEFEHPETGEIVDVVQKMSGEHVYENPKGVKWNRVWMSPNAAIKDNLINADTTAEEFVRKTKEKNYNVGEMWDLSKELSEKRKRVAGKDHVKEKTKKAYQKKCDKAHPHGND
jgi:hypothetical protein